MDRPVDPNIKDIPSTSAATKKGHLVRALVLIALALAAFGLWQFTKSRPAADKNTEALAPQVVAAKMVSGDIDQIVTGLGTVTPMAAITVQA
jgi:multidrug efflux system membrane fusion protein